MQIPQLQVLQINPMDVPGQVVLATWWNMKLSSRKQDTKNERSALWKSSWSTWSRHKRRVLVLTIKLEVYSADYELVFMANCLKQNIVKSSMCDVKCIWDLCGFSMLFAVTSLQVRRLWTSKDFKRCFGGRRVYLQSSNLHWINFGQPQPSYSTKAIIPWYDE